MEEVLNEVSHLFSFEKIKPNTPENIDSINSSKTKLFLLEEIKKTINLKPEMVDFELLIQKEKPLYGHDDKVIFFFSKNLFLKIYHESEKNGSNFDEEQFLENLNYEKSSSLRKYYFKTIFSFRRF